MAGFFLYFFYTIRRERCDVLKYDLHLHSNFSDGQFDPDKVIDLAIERGMSGIAITDHDTVDGIPVAENYLKENNISDFELIRGIEFGTTYLDDEVHILGYFIDCGDSKLVQAIDSLKKWRKQRSFKIKDKLNSMNIKISDEDIRMESNTDFTGRVPIAKALVKKGYVETISEAFEKYIGIGGPAYVDKDNLSIEEIISLIKKSGGVAVLAHPILLSNEETVEHVRNAGIDGIECVHSKHDKETIRRFYDYAQKYNLLTTGGSDCHGRLVDGELLVGKYTTSQMELEKIREVHNARRKTK